MQGVYTVNIVDQGKFATSMTTAEDYFSFASMLANGGELNGVRILSPASVTLMSSNHLAANLLTGEFSIGGQVMRPGFGYGYNCAVEFDPPLANLPDGRGTFFWDGAAGTWFWIDPANDVVFVGMIQRLLGPDSPNVEYLSRPLVYEASFTGGVYVAAGDVNGDGVPDLFISPDEGGGPRVRVFRWAGFTPLESAIRRASALPTASASQPEFPRTHQCPRPSRAWPRYEPRVRAQSH